MEGGEDLILKITCSSLVGLKKKKGKTTVLSITAVIRTTEEQLTEEKTSRFSHQPWLLFKVHLFLFFCCL